MYKKIVTLSIAILMAMLITGCGQKTTTVPKQNKSKHSTKVNSYSNSNTASTNTDKTTTNTKPITTDKTQKTQHTPTTKTDSTTKSIQTQTTKQDTSPKPMTNSTPTIKTTSTPTPTPKPTPKPMTITSPAFLSNGLIPAEYTCKGSDYNPQINIYIYEREDIKSLALIMDDPDAPNGTWVHWVMYNIDPKTTVISKNNVPTNAKQGLNSWGTAKYGGPCPPTGTHRYYFKVYALNTTLNLSHPTKAQLLSAMNGHIVDQAELMGKFSK